ncbi:hypothetical protein [Zooshikella sp. RANM57]|uniref:hypothetical protein n=1 Tax=Zooshikella sp. RANM57 TaxID=3425863 RepID=UPI003D6FB88B
MRNIAISIFLCLGASTAFAEASCAEGIINKVDVGDENKYIKVQMLGKSEWHRVNAWDDINNEVNGIIFLKSILLAKSTGAKVQLVDQRGGTCDDWNKILIK